MNVDAKKRRQQRINQLHASQQSWQDWRGAPPRNHFLYKCLLCLIVYVLVWTVFQLEHSYALRTQRTIKDVMNTSFDYEALSAWYQEHIGSIPSLLPAYDDHPGSLIETELSSPVSGHIVNGDMEQTGFIQLSTAKDRTVTSIGRGLVQFVKPSNHNRKTVSVLHTDGLVAIYDGLESVEVGKNVWLEEGAIIGHTSVLNFALKIGDQYVNPQDVIPFD